MEAARAQNWAVEPQENFAAFSAMERKITFRSSNLHVRDLEMKSAGLVVSQEGNVACC
jgi:hypothetical protein